MRKYYFISFLLVTSAFSCQKKAVKNTDTSSKTDASIKNTIIDQNIDITNTGSAYTIDSLSIKNDVLSIFVSYQGGCKEHVFDLYSNGKYAKSFPVQMALCLKHTGNVDNCKMLIMQELKFNIASIKNSNYETIDLKIGANFINYN